MKQYVLTEEQYEQLFKNLELEKFRIPDQFATTEESRKAQINAVEHIHRRFHVLVAQALG